MTNRSDRNQDQHAQDNREHETESLKAREYRDKDGNVHHHTKAYMGQHDGGREESGRSSGS